MSAFDIIERAVRSLPSSPLLMTTTEAILHAIRSLAPR